MKRPLCVFGAGFLTTMAVALTYPLAAAPLLAVTASVGLLRPKKRTLSCVLLVAGIAALGRVGLANHQLKQLRVLEGESVSFQGYVCRTDPWDPSRLLLRTRISGRSYGLWLDAGSGDWRSGDWLEATAVITAVEEDTQNFFFTGAITLLATVEGEPKSLTPQWFAPLADVAAMREELLHQARIHGTGEGIHLVTGLLFSADEELSSQSLLEMRRAGISHLLSVSGFHMSVVLGWTALKMPRSRLRRGLRLVICLGLAASVLALAGYGAAAMRAGVLGMMTVLAGCLNRRSDPWTSLVLSAMLLTAVSPLLLTDLGFQLSFCATAGIFALSGPLKNFWEEWAVRFLGSRWRRGRSSFCSCLGVLEAAQLSAAPILALRLATVPLLSVPINLLVLPLVYLAMLLGAVGVGLLMTPCSMAGQLLLRGACWCGEGILALAGFWSRLPGCTLSMVYPGRVLLLGIILLLALLPLLPLSRRRKRKLALAAAAVGLTIQLTGALALGDRVQLLAFPESDALALFQGRRQVVVAGGEKLWQLRRLEEELLDAGITRPDLLIWGGGEPGMMLEAARTIRPRFLAAPAETLAPVERLLPSSVAGVELGKETIPFHRLEIRQEEGELTEIELAQTKLLKYWSGYAIMDHNRLLKAVEEGALVADRKGRLWLPRGTTALPRPAGVWWVLGKKEMEEQSLLSRPKERSGGIFPGPLQG